MHALNYCRQASISIQKEFLDVPGTGPSGVEWLRRVQGLLRDSVKFLLPPGGRLIGDQELRALDPSEPVNLPFPVIALEYPGAPVDNARDLARGRELSERCSKRIVIAYSAAGYIVLQPVIWFDQQRTWVPLPECALPLTNYFKRVTLPDGSVVASYVLRQKERDIPTEDYADEVESVLSFLNALQCANVRSEKLPPTKPPGKLKKDVLPFDTYHVLTVDPSPRDHKTGESIVGGHRSPREHLRRGHIRRYASGLRIFVQATVVNPGVAGSVVKDYKMIEART